MKLIFDQVREIEPSRVVFDSLSEMRLLAQSSLRYRRQILALKHFFAGRKCTVLLLDDLSSHADDLQLHSISHGVILLEQFALDYGAGNRTLAPRFAAPGVNNSPGNRPLHSLPRQLVRCRRGLKTSLNRTSVSPAGNQRPPDKKFSAAQPTG